MPVALEVSVDPELCIGSGDCVARAPRAFVLDDALAVSRPLPDAASVDRGPVLAAAIGCPTQAIRVAEDGIALHESNGGGSR
jgi:ferredoxin